MTKRFLADESGAVAIEYVLIAALIALAIIAGARELGTSLGSGMETIGTSVSDVLG